MSLNAGIRELTGNQLAAEGDGRRSETTGRNLVLFREDGIEDGIRVLERSAGCRVTSSADFADGMPDDETLASADAMVFSDLGVATVAVSPEQVEALQRLVGGPIEIVEPERMNYAYGNPDFVTRVSIDRDALSPSYLEGFRDAADHLLERVTRTGPSFTAAAGDRFQDDRAATWGIHACRVPSSPYSGAGIRVAVLDTGFDSDHPDFRGRTVVAKSFVPDESAEDGHGHGTHCIGTACGPRDPQRYGVAYEADIYAGKVLSNEGRGPDMWIIAGLNWAVGKRCQVASLSLGAPRGSDDPPSRIFEKIAHRAMRAGTLIVAASGNESERDRGMEPEAVGHPANCPSVLAVAAVDRFLEIADFSNRGFRADGGKVDIAGPGVDVRSSWKGGRYRTIDGTSMATPHVAGIAALLFEANPGITPEGVWALLMQNARGLSLPSADVGAGLVQAPQNVS